MTWYHLDSGAGSPAFNMALDEALLKRVSELGRPILRFYGWSQPAATFGHLQRYALVEKATHLRPLIRRPTGGGVVAHDADWTYSLTVPPGHEWHALTATDSYHRIHSWIREAFLNLQIKSNLAPDAFVSPGSIPIHPRVPGSCFVGYEKFDLLFEGRKIAGAAQRRNRSGLLIQGSIQPLPGMERALWQESMLMAGTRLHGMEWQAWQPGDAEKVLAELLERSVYSSESHQKKR